MKRFAIAAAAMLLTQLAACTEQDYPPDEMTSYGDAAQEEPAGPEFVSEAQAARARHYWLEESLAGNGD